jgi:hypothetical protein
MLFNIGLLKKWFLKPVCFALLLDAFVTTTVSACSQVLTDFLTQPLQGSEMSAKAAFCNLCRQSHFPAETWL